MKKSNLGIGKKFFEAFPNLKIAIEINDTRIPVSAHRILSCVYFQTALNPEYYRPTNQLRYKPAGSNQKTELVWELQNIDEDSRPFFKALTDDIELKCFDQNEINSIISANQYFISDHIFDKLDHLYQYKCSMIQEQIEKIGEEMKNAYSSIMQNISIYQTNCFNLWTTSFANNISSAQSDKLLEEILSLNINNEISRLHNKLTPDNVSNLIFEEILTHGDLIGNLQEMGKQYFVQECKSGEIFTRFNDIDANLLRKYGYAITEIELCNIQDFKAESIITEILEHCVYLNSLLIDGSLSLSLSKIQFPENLGQLKICGCSIPTNTILQLIIKDLGEDATVQSFLARSITTIEEAQIAIVENPLNLFYCKDYLRSTNSFNNLLIQHYTQIETHFWNKIPNFDKEKKRIIMLHSRSIDQENENFFLASKLMHESRLRSTNTVLKNRAVISFDNNRPTANNGPKHMSAR